MEVRFPEGFYEDVPWLYPVLLGAARIAVLDRVCIHYRQRRTGAGSILQTVSRRHFDVFEQYRRTFDFLELLPEAEQRLWQPVLFGRMARHYLAILEHPARLPAEARAEFFRRASADYRRRSPRGYRPPGGPAGLKERLLARGRRPLTRRLGPVGWAALRAGNRVRRALAELIGGTGPRRRRLNAIAGRCYHRLHRLLPLDPDLVLFEPEDGRNPAGRCEATAIDAELALLAPEFRRIWVGRDGGPGYPLPAGARRVAPGSRGHWRALARASFTVGGSGFGEGFGGGFGHGTAKRRGAVHLQTPPGTPLARIGAEQLDFPAGRQPADPERLLAGVDRWDYCTAANRHAAEVFERSYPGAYATLECGSPANDRLLRARAADVLRIRRHLGVPDGAVAVLYAPTHRDHERRLRPRFDPAEFAAAAGPGFVLLMRAGAGQETPSEQVIDVSAHPSAHELCLASDALLTDYSPLLFDYANLDRPIVLHTEDWELYRSVRGTSLDLLAAPPGHTARQPAAMAELFRTGAYDDESAARLRGEFRSRFCEFDDGQAAERVVRRVFMGEHEPLPFVPPELRCPAPAPPKALAEARAEARAERSVPAPAEAVTLQEANRTKT
jgi:hypothetical protein